MLNFKLKIVIPSVITSLRIILLPKFMYSAYYDNQIIVNGLFLFLIFTDLLDGYLARKLGASTKKGTRLDLMADFLMIIGTFVIFVTKGFYNMWLLILILATFVQFILTSYFFRKIYDPIGKYYGSLLYGAIGLTLLFSEKIVYDIVTIGIIIFTVATFLSRFIYLTRTKNY